MPLRPHNRWAGAKALRERWQAHIDSTLCRPVLLVDEAQEMTPAVLNELRMPEQPHQLPAAPASLIAPEDRQVLEGDLANYNFAWASVGNAARYHLEVSADSEFKQLPY